MISRIFFLGESKKLPLDTFADKYPTTPTCILLTCLFTFVQFFLKYFDVACAVCSIAVVIAVFFKQNNDCSVRLLSNIEFFIKIFQ